ncbi:MAG: Crp/Fnr family transcriptional regulator [Saprospiraceae bacterium]
MDALEPFVLPPDLLERVLRIGVKKIYNRGHRFINGQSPANLLFFVQKGAIRNCLRQEEFELTFWIGIEQDFFCTIGFFSGTAAENFLEVMETLEVVEIKRDQLQQAYLQDPGLERFGRLLAEYQLQVLERNHRLIREKSALKRYHLFLDSYPQLNGRVHQKYLASLLNLDQATLSRVRRKSPGLKPEEV